MVKRISFVIVPLVVLAWLTLLPTRVEPVAWVSPSTDDHTALYPSNEALAPLQRLFTDYRGPEALLVEEPGVVTMALADGRIVSSTLDGKTQLTLADTTGRPLGLARHPDGRLIIADAQKGLLSLDASGQLTLLADSAEGLRFGFTDDVTIDAAGRYAYFSDASSRWGYGQDDMAIIEHGGDGRLLRYDFDTGETEVLLNNLQFANGVALSADESYVLVCETGAYRVTRYFLSGGRIGSFDTFIDNLPGFPDNIRRNASGEFWLAVYAPRNPLLDAFSEYPSLRKAMARAMVVLPKPVAHRAMAMRLSDDGEVQQYVQNTDSKAYAPITTATEFEGALYLGSLTEAGIARWRLQP